MKSNRVHSLVDVTVLLGKPIVACGQNEPKQYVPEDSFKTSTSLNRCVRCLSTYYGYIGDGASDD